MRRTVSASLIVCAVVAGACKEERSITSAPEGTLGFGQNMGKAASNLPRGRAIFPATPAASATPAADSIIIEFSGMDSLSTGSYVVWVGNDSATKFAPATGTLTILRTDTTINAVGDPVITSSTTTSATLSSFKNGRSNYFMRFAATRASVPALAATDSANLFLVSVEPGATGALPGERRVLWGRRSQSAALGTPARQMAGMRFGNFAARLTEEYPFATSAATANAFGPTAFTATTLIIPRGRIEVRGPIFTVNDSNYYRPPVGYYYEAWAIRTDTLGRFIDTISLGQKATPYPKRLSYYEADKTIVDPTYMFGTPFAVIFASQHRVSADTISAAVINGRAWREFSFVYVTLQNKAAPTDRMGAVAIMTVATPSSVTGR